ncbi:MAG: radical SAM protein [Elusimicrobiales bacterium]
MPDCLPSARLNALTLRKNIPVSVTIELTRRCPLSCRHCYLPETRGRAVACAELSTSQWGKILAQLARAGGLYLVFTGGEPLLRPDLPELCRRAKKLNFDVRVFSTGLGLTPGLAREFKAAGVSGFEISFYGRPAVHDGITGLEGSFRRSLAAARLLKKAGVKVKMKAPLMSLNPGQAGWLKRLAAAEGFGISFDPVIAPGNDGDPGNLKYRLSGRRLRSAVKGLSGGPAVAQSAFPAVPDFICGAGRNVCAVGPDGSLYPCLQLPVKLAGLTGTSFRSAWKNSPWLKKWRRAGMKDLEKCRACGLKEYCSLCPGISLLENGDALSPNSAACALARVQASLKK